MNFKTTRDVLDRVIEFHQQLHDLYQHLSDIAEKERVKLLLEYMAQHEEHLRESLAEYEGGASEKILNTWFKYVPSSTILKDCSETQLNPDMSVEEIIDTALRFDDCLVDFYKTMAENSGIEEIEKIFLNLSNMERHEKMNFVRDAQQVNDM